ncbi:MAG TPA: glycosyltransferase, partial [Candidatus Polarisedimenticolia bacterium]|nr:glycosyltransferase [Candidatus Polarisedimenticolia bacterium]
MVPTPTAPIRIVHVMNALAVAGMEVGVMKLVNRQDPERFRSTICCLTVALENARPLLHPRTPVVVLGKRPGIDFSLFPKLVRLFRKERPHIVHSHNWATLLYTIVAAKIARVPVVIHGEHGYEDQAAIERRLGTKRLLARHVTRLTTVSANIERLLIDNWHVP